MNNEQLGIDASKAETVEQFKALVEANENGLFKLGPRNNNRKSTRGRRIQVIKVRKYIVNPELKDDIDILNAKSILKKYTDNAIDKAFNSDIIYCKKLFRLNINKFAGKTKTIFHQPSIR